MGLDHTLPAGGAPAASRPHEQAERGGLAPALVFGFAVASVGGPVALVYQLLPSVLGSAAMPSIGLVTLLALALFAFPVLVWYRYSTRVVAAGGLYAFVEAAAGRTAARVHGAVWIVSYFLYLPATVTFVVYELLPALAPGVVPYRPALQLLLPIAFTASVLAPLRATLPAVALLGAGQLVLLLVLGGLEVGRVGFPLASLAPHANGEALGRGTAAASLLFLCASLPLYLGGAVRGGATIRRAVAGSSALVGAYALFAAVPLASVPAADLGGSLPAYTLGAAYGGHALAVVAGSATVLSILALVFAEFVALGRLLAAMAKVRLGSGVLAIGALFLGADALALLGPDRAYDEALRPSLGALYLSQLVVFAVYPLFERTRRLLLATPVALLAAGPLVYGLYLVVSDRIAT